METTTTVSQVQAPYRPGMPDRRHHKPDLWAVMFRVITLLVYPLLIVFLFIFFGVASADHSRGIAVQMGVPAPATIPNSHVDLYTLLPLLLAGILVGATGFVLSCKRARRRFDYNYQTQLLLVILSVGGLAIFFVVH